MIMDNEFESGLRKNWKQFSLLVLINAFVGGMVGMERTILPQLASEEFGLVAHTAILSFIIVFGVTKAFTNYFMGSMANRLGRKNLLLLGWIIALPIPWLVIYAPSWGWVVFANVLLGINQGLTWSSTVVMKIDLVGSKNRGLAMGINESAGYMAVGLIALLTGYLASSYGIRPVPFYTGVILTLLGIFLTWIFVRDTAGYVAKESVQSDQNLHGNVFWETTWKNPNLGSVTQAGLVNNLNDGMIWGLFPILLAGMGFGLDRTGLIVSVYPLVWGLGQLVTGRLADVYKKKSILFLGMFLQGIVIAGFVYSYEVWHFVGLSILLGVGTALVYPTFLAAIADYSHPEQRAKSIGVFRLWRDLGYALGALISGVVADYFGIRSSIILIAGLTVLSSLIIKIRMR